MLRSINEIRHYRIHATDGDFGRVADFLFDDQSWVTRYLVVDTGTWLPGRQVLISPTAIRNAEWESRKLFLSLNQRLIEASPEIARGEPLSRQQEQALSAHFGWPVYWHGYGELSHTESGRPRQPAMAVAEPPETVERTDMHDPHLRSVADVCGYKIEALDGTMGHVEDFIADDQNWELRYMIVDTRNWWPGKKVLIAPMWIESFEWEDSRCYVGLDKEMIKNSPQYDPNAPVNRGYEEALHDYYGRPRYWEE